MTTTATANTDETGELCDACGEPGCEEDVCEDCETHLDEHEECKWCGECERMCQTCEACAEDHEICMECGGHAVECDGCEEEK